MLSDRVEKSLGSFAGASSSPFVGASASNACATWGCHATPNPVLSLLNF